ncbi:tetratricopeptide repeat protein [Streptomyces sp. NPDC002514]|uniref:tetratricopeptide repeat protein n=1 Tax=unclassified Streptomyces TaxID=2593676 RepID=UPI00369AF948
MRAARDLDSETLRRSTEIFGADHPSTPACAANLAMNLRETGRTADADALHSATAERLRATLGEEHPAVVQALDTSRRANCDIDPMPL